MRVIFFWKCWNFNADLKNAARNEKKIFCFWDKCVWIVYIELSLLIREYLSSAVKVLTKSLKTFHVTKSDFSNSITFTVINQYSKGALIKIESVFRPVYHVGCRGVLSNRDLLDIYLSTSFNVGNFRNKEAMRVIFFWKVSKFNTVLKNAEKN